MNIDQIMKSLTIEEKVRLLSGENFWQTSDIERLDIPRIMMNDGPHGMRVQGGEGDHLGIHSSLPSTCFPTGSALACSWDRHLVEEVGKHIAQEAKSLGASIVLGPAANIKRSPLCGRNFEYFSEDPFLSKEIAIAHVNGVQSQGLGSSLKHFVANSQEHERLTIDALIDERTLRELYLYSFEDVVKEAQPWTVMCAYNKVNGLHVSEHPTLLREILKEEWGHEGLVVSDWGAVNNRLDGLKAGLELEMPGNGGQSDAKLIEAYKAGDLSDDILDDAVRRVLELVSKSINNKDESASYDQNVHHDLAVMATAECGILLKNEDEILPLSAKDKVLVIGEFATYTRYQGGGSSHVNATRVDIHLDEVKKVNPGVQFEQGYDIQLDQVDDYLEQRAIDAAKKVDKVVCYLGLPDHYESEGFDRDHMQLPYNQLHLMDELVKVSNDIVVVLSNGSVVELPWIDQVKGVLEMYLGGQGVATAATQILFGEVNPSGKLAETWPIKLEHNPSHLNFPGHSGSVHYQEGLYVGYKYYDKKNMAVNFPFGHGLSYTNFNYKDLKLDIDPDNDIVTCKVMIENSGSRAGKEVIQVYVSHIDSKVDQPIKRLASFEKVHLNPGQIAEVALVLPKRVFEFYSVEDGQWVSEESTYQILVGASAMDIRLDESIQLGEWQPKQKNFHYNSLLKDVLRNPEAAAIFNEVSGKAGHMPNMQDASEEERKIMEAMMGYTPLRGLVLMSQGEVTFAMLDELIEELNKL